VSRPLRDLARTLSRRCRGRTLVVGRPFPPLLESLSARGRDVESRPLSELAAESATFDTVVLVRAIEYVPEQETTARVRQAWSRVAPQGRLLVCVPNGSHADEADDVRQRFTRRSLKKLLKTVDQPKLLTDQPYRWLAMTVDRDAPPDRANALRYEAIARLCRGRVLELGCGPGHLCGKIAGRGLEVTGVDKNDGKVAKASRLYPRIRFRQADILTLPEEPRYDTVVLAEVLEHVTAELGSRMLAKAWELVAPGGRLVVGVPNEDCVRHANHLQEFTEDDLAGMLRRFGRVKVATDQPFKWLLLHVTRTKSRVESK